ncbi:hypothetical protein [Barnesiella sp. WM24]|uniref:hypothetical protein n=1 Tax=Barnesiella sp. WM24 TaxID=2558278 RepID=UPI001ADDD8B6|nr:hypothetical protein [Barnesiella sp. WM24]
MKQLKSELAALDRKITAELAPTHEVPDDRMGVNKEEQDGVENKQQPDTQRVEVRDNHAQATGPKETMVAEPMSPGYRQQREPISSLIIIGGCGATPSSGFCTNSNWQKDNRSIELKL